MYDVNLLAVLIAAVLNMVVGYIWYSPMVFGKTWMKMTGVTNEGMKKEMGKTLGLGMVASLITAYVLAQFLSLSGVTTIGEGAMLAFWAWIGFTATAMYSAVLYERKAPKLWAINVGYYLAAYIVMAAVLVLWV